MSKFRFVSALVALVVVLAACSPAATTQAPAAPATQAAPAATQPPASAPMETAAPTTGGAAPTSAAAAPTSAAAAPTSGGAAAVVATISPDSLVQKNHLLICTDFPYPPQEFYDENGNPQGLDVEIGTEIANRLGLKVQFVNSVFDTIIAAVTSGKCDIVISAQNITTDRQKQVNMIPYFKAGQSFVALKGNPEKITQASDLCGKTAAAESGTTEAFYLQGTGDYQGKGLTQECDKAGKPLKVVVTQKDTDALQQLQAGKVAVYATDSPVAAYYVVQHPDQFEVVGKLIDPAMEGISVPCGQKDCTSAPLTPTGQAVKAALLSMISDGTYGKILDKWKLSDSAVTADIVNQQK